MELFICRLLSAWLSALPKSGPWPPLKSHHSPLLLLSHLPVTVWPFLIILCFVSPLHLLLLSSESESFCGFPWHPHRCPPSAQHLAFCVRISCAFVSLQLKAISQLGVLARSGESQALSSLQTDVRKRSKLFALPDSGFRPPLSLY